MKQRETLRDWLTADDFTLTMSAGFFSFFAHLGVLSVLEAEGFIPRKVTGASAGAMTVAMWAAGLDTAALREHALHFRKADFWDPGLGLGLLRGCKFRQMLAALAPVGRLEECRVPVALSVYDAFALKTRVVCTGPLVDAVYASCALPFFFQPLRRNGRLFWDGGIEDRPGLAGAGAERVFYHHIISKSPWRRINSPSLRLPQRPNMAALVIDGLQRVTPDTLGDGRLAYEQGRAAMQQALEAPLAAEGVVLVSRQSARG